MTTNDETHYNGIPLIPEPSQDWLNQKQHEDYRIYRRQFLRWLDRLGKDPKRATGFSHDTVRRTAYRVDQFYRWVWEHEDGYTTGVTQAHADDFIQELAYADKSATHKSNTLSALKRLFKWFAYQHGGDLWEPEVTFSRSGSNRPRDQFSPEERRKLREAALEYDSVPNYNDLSPTQRDRWKAHIAQKLGKPKEIVSPKDWEEVESWSWRGLRRGIGKLVGTRFGIVWGRICRMSVG